MRAFSIVSCRNTALFAAAVSCTLVTAGISRAGLSTVSSPAVSEDSQAMVLDHIYGGNFTLEGDGVDYSNGPLSAVRVADYLPSSSLPQDPGPGATDQLWEGNGFFATDEAAFAAAQSTSFGYISGASGGTYQALFSLSGSNLNVSGSGSVAASSQTFRFGVSNPFGLVSTADADNLDGQDHVVTYQVNGLNDGDKTWLLFFDDYGSNGNNPDFDYQDVVIQLKSPVASAVTAPTSVPEPSSLMMIGGIAIALLKRTRRPL